MYQTDLIAVNIIIDVGQLHSVYNAHIVTNVNKHGWNTDIHIVEKKRYQHYFQLIQEGFFKS